MTDNTSAPPSEFDELKNRIDSIDKRLARLEKFLGYKPGSSLEETGSVPKTDEAKKKTSNASTESRFGEQVFSWISAVVVLFLVVFIMIFFQSKEKPGMAILFGYATTAAVIVISQLLRKSFPKQVYLLRIISHILLFYVTLYLHFFTDSPIISNTYPALLILFAPIGYLFYFAFRQKSQSLVILGIIMVITAILLSDQTNIILAALSLISAFGVLVYYKKEWSSTLYFAIIAVYTTHFIWFIGNPVAGNGLKLIEAVQGSLYFLFSYGFIFSTIALLKPRSGYKQGIVTASALWNAVLFSGILLLSIFEFYTENYALIFGAITAFSLSYSVWLKLRDSFTFIFSFYAIVSFVSLSILLFGFTGFPEVYPWLALQSLLVVSIALWFRSPLIVIANTLMFVGILGIYLIQGEISNLTNIILALVSGLTARFINWKKERLNLKTEAIRNTYLITLFFSALFALYHLVPQKFVTLSWVGAAALFFGLSYILKAKKYRWMAFATLVFSVIYLFFFQLKSMELGFRILAFSAIAVITLITSFYYSRKSNKEKLE